MPQPYLDVLANGRSLKSLGPSLDRLDVDLVMGGPSSAIITWRLPSKSVAADVGKPLEVKVIDEAGKKLPIFKGTVTSIQVGYTNRGTTTTIVAQDDLYALARGRNSAHWVNTTLVDAAKAVLSARGLSVQTGAKNTVHDVVVQHDETDLQFVRRLGAEIGFDVWVDNGTAHFDQPTSEGAEIVLGPDDVLRLNVGENISQQVTNVEVSYWDPQAKKAGTARSTVRLNGPKDQALGQTSDHVFGWPVALNAAAQDLAGGIGMVVQNAHKTMQAMVPGEGRLRPGVAVKLEKIDAFVDGSYLITRARHHHDPERGYEVEIDSAPYRDLSLGALNGHNGGTSGSGAVSAIVSSIKDPKGQGRVELELPWTEPVLKVWARVALPGAGQNRGLNIMPEVNDEVFVVFEHQDLRRPVVVGGAYNGKDKSKMVTTDDTKVLQRTWHSRTGHALILDDDKPTSGLRVETADGKNTLHLKEKEGAIEITADKGGILLTTKTGDITLKGKNVTITSQAKTVITGNGGVKVNSKAKLELSGTAGSSLKSPAIVEVKGSLLKLN